MQAASSCRSSRSEVSYKEAVLKNFVTFIGKHLCQSLTQVFYYKFFEIFKSTFFHRTPPVAASVSDKLHLAATSLADLPFSSSCKALNFFQSNLDALPLFSHRKIEFCDVVKLDKNKQTQN